MHVTQSPQPPTYLPFPCSFPRIRSQSCLVTLSDYSHSFSILSPGYLSLFFIFPVWVNHMMITLLWLTKFSQHNTLHFYLHRRKCWVFIISNGWVIFHHIFRWTMRLHPQCLDIVDTAAINIGVHMFHHFIASVSDPSILIPHLTDQHVPRASGVPSCPLPKLALSVWCDFPQTHLLC